MRHDAPITAERIKQEHIEIEEMTTTLLRMLTERQETPSRVEKLLQALLERILAHFGDEETGGFISELAASDPDLAAKCRQLCRDHGRITGELERLVERAASGTGGAQWWDDLESQFHELSFHMVAHDRKTSELTDEADDAG